MADARGARRRARTPRCSSRPRREHARPARAEKLLREGLARAPADSPLRAALARRLRRDRHAATRRWRLPRRRVAEAPGDAAALARPARDASRARPLARGLDGGREGEGAGHAAAARDARDAGARRRRSRRACASWPPSPPTPRSAPATLKRRCGRSSPGTAGERRAAPRWGASRPTQPPRRSWPRPGAGAAARGRPGRPARLDARAGHGRRPRWSALAACRRPRALEAFDRPLLVAVMGEFNAGKSSFVNALCGAEVAPTGVTPTTATINVLRYGDRAGSARRLPRRQRASRCAAADVAALLAALRDEEARADPVWSRSSCPSRPFAGSRSSTRRG